MAEKSELEELVEFLHHGNTQIRQAASEHLPAYTLSDPAVFKQNQLEPIKDLKLLVRDYSPIAHNALTMLINLTSHSEPEVLSFLTSDPEFVETLFVKLTNPKEPNADDIAMLLANMVKSDDMKNLLTLERKALAPKELSQSKRAIDQLFDCFVRGADGQFNPNANFDYLAYVFADLSKYSDGQTYFTSPQPFDDNIVPLTKLIVFTEHSSVIRRRGVASTIKNIAFNISLHPILFSPIGPTSDTELSHIQGVNLLPYILLPLMGPEEYDEEDSDGMLDDLQLLPSDKKRESEPDILQIHLDTCLLLMTTKRGRETVKRVKVYPIVRELHLAVVNDDVRDACDRLVQILVRLDREVENFEEEDVLATPGAGALQLLEDADTIEEL